MLPLLTGRCCPLMFHFSLIYIAMSPNLIKNKDDGFYWKYLQILSKFANLSVVTDVLDSDRQYQLIDVAFITS